MAKQNEGQPSEAKLKGGVTQAEVNEWKAKHGEVFAISVEDKVGYFKKPSRATLAAALKHYGTSDTIKANELLMANCWLGGDSELKTIDSYFLACCNKLGELIEIKEAELKKL